MRILAWPAFRNKKDNPYNYLLYTHLQKLGITALDLGDVVRSPRQLWRVLWRGADILHIHWPEYALGLPFPRSTLHMLTLFSACLFHRSQGGKVVWTVHNLSPHENRYPFLEKWFYRALARVTDGLIFLTETSLAQFRADNKMRAFIGKPVAIVPHGHYLPIYPARVDRSEARKFYDLPLDGKVVAFFGALRPYKGVEELLAIAKQLSSKEVSFIIAGKPLSDEYERYLKHIAEGSSHIRFQAEFIPDDKVPLLFSAADVVILPYKVILNSGTVFLALSFGVPVMVPGLGSLMELAESYPHLVHVYKPPLTREKLLGLVKKVELSESEREREWKNYLRDFDWDRIAEETLRFYKVLISEG